ncbi:hypothetical protein ACTFIZ_003765 [Dictyostelium cf. discoideum]
MEQINQRGRSYEVGSLSIDYVSKLTDKIRSHCVSQVLSRLENAVSIENTKAMMTCSMTFSIMKIQTQFPHHQILQLNLFKVHTQILVFITHRIKKKKKISTFADLRSVSGALLGGMGSIGVAALGAYFIYTSEIGSVDFYMGVGFAAFGCLLVSDHYSK